MTLPQFTIKCCSTLSKIANASHNAVCGGAETKLETVQKSGINEGHISLHIYLDLPWVDMHIHMVIDFDTFIILNIDASFAILENLC